MKGKQTISPDDLKKLYGEARQIKDTRDKIISLMNLLQQKGKKQ
ncbi:TPA: hypothetical protein ACJFV9_004396 [Salmonella enterica subsp. enterica serovar Infantis]